MNAAFGFRFAAAFFAISSPCDGRPTGRRELDATYYAHTCTPVPVFSEGKRRKSVLFRGGIAVSRGGNGLFREKRRGRSPRPPRPPAMRRAANPAARAS